MDKEKEIQEMAHIVGKIKYGFFAGCEDESCGDCYIYRVGIDCGYLKQAEQLYLAGYRKADEVRRETAKEIIKLISGMGDWGNLSDIICEITDKIAEKYGVEVDE